MVGPGPKSPGGMRTVVENYCEGFNADKEVEVCYVGIGTRGSFVRKCLYYVKQLKQVVEYLRTHSFDICHVHMGDKGGVFRSGIVVVLANHYGCKTITHMHAGNMMLWYSTLTAPLKAVVRFFLNASDSFVVLGRLWKDALSDLVPDEKIVVIYNGVRIGIADHLSSNKVIFLYLGVLKKQKGLSELLDAVAQLREQFACRAQLLIAGTVFDFDIEREIASRGIENVVQYVGWVGPDERDDLFKKANVSVLPSYYEGLPMSVLEAMAAGLPCIATPVGAIPEVIVSDLNGILVQPKNVYQLKDAMLRFIEEDGLVDRLGNSARKTIEARFDVNEQLRVTKQLYDFLNPQGVKS